MLKFSLLLSAFLDEDFDLLDFLSHLHHSQIPNLFGSLNSTPLKVLPQLDNHRVKTQSKQQFFFELILNLIDDKTMFLHDTLLEGKLSDVKVALFFELLSHFVLVYFIILSILLGCTFIQVLFFVNLEKLVEPSYIDI